MFEFNHNAEQIPVHFLYRFCSCGRALFMLPMSRAGFLGNPYTAVSMQRRITVLMHMTAFLILGYNRETYMFDITTLLFGAVSLVFLLFAVKLLDRFYYEGLSAHLDGDAVSDGCELDYFYRGWSLLWHTDS